MSDIANKLQETAAPYLAPVPGAAPAGIAAKFEPEYQELANEVAKLDLPTGGEINWKKVVTQAGDLLKGKSKDVLVASYLAHALHRTTGVEGLATGLAVMNGLLEQYWDNAFPEVKRLRGRANAVQWLVEKTQILLEGAKYAAKDAPAMEGLDEAARKLQELVRGKFADQAPAMGPLIESVNRAKQAVEAAKPPPPKPAAPPPPPAAAAPGGDAGSAPAPSASGDAQAAVAGGASVTMPAAPAAQLADPAQISEFLRTIGTSLISAAGAVRRAAPADPVSYRVLRTGLWLHFAAPPPATAGKTTVPAPPAPMRAQLQTLAQNQKWQALLEEAESALTNQRFWLDLHRYTAQALTGLGHDRPKEAIHAEVRTLLARMPALPTLTFADGTPLADPQTKSWLEEEVAPKASGKGGGEEKDASDEKLAAAKKQLGAGQLAEALAAIQAVVRERPAGRAKFRARLELARACGGANLLPMARSLYEELDREVVSHQLDEWEPQLAAECLKGLISTTRALTKDPRGAPPEQLARHYQRLCRLDPAAAHEVWP